MSFLPSVGWLISKYLPVSPRRCLPFRIRFFSACWRVADVDKVTQINDDIDRMRHSATKALLERRDTIVVASVSCIYGLGMPARFINSALRLVVGEYPAMGYADPALEEGDGGGSLPEGSADFSDGNVGLKHLDDFAAALEAMCYERDDSLASPRGRFCVGIGGSSVDIGPASDEFVLRVGLDDLGRVTSIDVIESVVSADLKSEQVGQRSVGANGLATDAAFSAPYASKTANGAGEAGEVSQVARAVGSFVLYPARHHVLDESEKEIILQDIGRELEARCAALLAAGKTLEEARLRQRTENDLLMLRMVDTCKGVENYSRHLARRPAGAPPDCLVDYFPRNDWLLLVDESHVTAPQVKGMYEGDRRRKSNLVEHGFRLPSALDNRPLRAEEFWSKSNQCVFISATPGKFERELSSTWNGGLGDSGAGNSMQAISDAVSRLATKPRFGAKGASDTGGGSGGGSLDDREVWWDAEAVIRPTGIIDPAVHIRPSHGQVDDLLHEIITRSARNERVLVTTLTKRMAEDLDTFFQDSGVKSSYIHSNVKPLARLEILQSLREGGIDVLVGVNLLREGLNLPEVSLVAILDADKEGFLRSDTALIQTIGRATRNVHGEAILYADMVTKSMQRALDETSRRRAIQLQYNEKTGKIPTTATSVRGTTEDSILETIQHFHASNGNGPRRDAGKLSFSEFEAMKDGDSAALLGWKKEDDPIALGALRLAAHEKMQSASAAREYDEAAAWRDMRNSIAQKLGRLETPTSSDGGGGDGGGGGELVADDAEGGLAVDAVDAAAVVAAYVVGVDEGTATNMDAGVTANMMDRADMEGAQHEA